jgi:serine/threonine protein kinase
LFEDREPAHGSWTPPRFWGTLLVLAMAAAKQSEREPQEASGEQPTSAAEAAQRGGLSAGQVLVGRYRLEALLGRGGMGEVWRAVQLPTLRQVAVKLLHSALLHQPDMRRRSLREARVASAINHPNVVEVLDAFELEDGTPALVMPLLEGESLGSLLSREGQLAVGPLLSVLVPLVSAVAAAHEQHVIHRDLKPDNVFLAREGDATVVKVLDFGIAKLVGDEGSTDSTITGTGTLIGTPCYMAPEQAFGERDQDHRVDIYAIGVVAYEALSGCRPVEGENIGHVVKTMLTQATTPLGVVAPTVPARLAALVMKLLARDKQRRPQTLAEVLTELREIGEGADVNLAAAGAVASHPPGEPSTLVSPRDAGGSEEQLQEPTPTAPRSLTPAEHSITQAPPSTRPRTVLWPVGGLLALGLVAALALRAVKPPLSAPLSSASARAPLVLEPSAAVAPLPSAVVEPAPSAVVEPAPSAVVEPAPSVAVNAGGVVAAPHRPAPSRTPVAKALATKPLPSASPVATPAPLRGGLQEEPPF